jgi:hypothetical protein
VEVEPMSAPHFPREMAVLHVQERLVGPEQPFRDRLSRSGRIAVTFDEGGAALERKVGASAFTASSRA